MVFNPMETPSSPPSTDRTVVLSKPNFAPWASLLKLERHSAVATPRLRRVDGQMDNVVVMAQRSSDCEMCFWHHKKTHMEII